MNSYKSKTICVFTTKRVDKILIRGIMYIEPNERRNEMLTIAELRARNGKMTQKELAELLGVQPNTVYRWEKYPLSMKAEYIVKLSQTFNVSSDELLGIKNKQDA